MSLTRRSPAEEWQSAAVQRKRRPAAGFRGLPPRDGSRECRGYTRGGPPNPCVRGGRPPPRFGRPAPWSTRAPRPRPGPAPRDAPGPAGTEEGEGAGPVAARVEEGAEPERGEGRRAVKEGGRRRRRSHSARRSPVRRTAGTSAPTRSVCRRRHSGSRSQGERSSTRRSRA